ncbi:hypothetical protein CASFOL_041714 [Castilleja foliolosa]|uniref:DNA helicase n=1 Tax=Castilleja foliolosa TaxID=1961234 RepID=A0ABD3B8E7_9LAMI
MAPRKKISSGGKKSSHPNRETQQPAQPSIQHFFERHSQSQKTLSHNSSKRNADYKQIPISDPAPAPFNKPQTVPTRNDLDPVEAGVENPGGMTNLDKFQPMGKHSRGEKLKNDSVISGPSSDGVSRIAECRNSSSVGVVDFQNKGGKSEESNPSQATPIENILPIVIDDEEDNRLEVSPEASKSLSVKRFKFSPGMLIKQSQDDFMDEVTWKISPVNERLNALSKNLPGRMRILADSTRVQTSPGRSGKLGKWLSSPPIKPDKNYVICSDGHESRMVNPAHDSNSHGNNRNISSNGKSEVQYTQSPFSTPPSLSCCLGKDVDYNGEPDPLGLRQHKKALIELLDEVEDVIFVEHSSSNVKETISDAERRPNSDPVISSRLSNSEETKSSKDSSFSYLVLEVSENHGSAESSGHQPCFKVLRLLNEQSGAERALQLWDEWYFSVIAPGDTVHVIGEFDAQGKCDVNREKNFLIVHPDILVSGTRVSSYITCPRRTVLDERLKSSEHSSAALMGTLLHQIFQAGLISEFPTKEFLEEYARTVLQKSLESLYACGVNENDTWKTLIDAIPKILNWISYFRDSEGSRNPSVDFKCDEGLKKIKISEVIDIEEMAWAPKYGLKGMIDASVRVRSKTTSGEASELIMPLEFKTGKATSGQSAMEHNAQVMLYTLLMSERYMMNIEHGLLYYLHTDQTQGISVRRSDLIGLIMRRNELANDLFKALTTQQLPPMIQNPNMCRNCRHLSVCTIYHKAYGGNAEGSGLGDVYDSLVSHLTITHTVFLKKWERLIDLEANHLEGVKKERWSNHSRNDHHPICLSSLVIDASDKPSQKKVFRGNQFIYRFVLRETHLLDKEQRNGDSSSSSSSLVGVFRIGDYVILSSEPSHLRVANGVIVDIGNSHISVSFSKRLRLPWHNLGSMSEALQQQSWRIDKDETMSSFAIMRYNLIQLFLNNENGSHLRKLVVNLEMPRFDSGCIFSQDPAISYVWSEKSLNDDQRRAILKILTAKDYALILGMPGTGKTSTMVHAVKALLMRGSSILLTSYTNSAVDNLLIKLKAQGIDFIRIGRHESVHEEIQDKCLSVMDMVSTQEIKEKMEEINVVAFTCLGINSPLLTNKKFDICIMDEAGQITLPVSLGPLMLASKFVLVGDHYQLPPLVQSPEAKENGMSVSLFCRLSEAHPQAIASLHSQYRMCKSIMELSNALIYGNRLRCGSREIENAKLEYNTCSESSSAWLMEVLNPNQPVIFINTDFLPAYESNDRKAINNPTEAYIIGEVTKNLVLRGIEGQDIGIITPYNAQADLIREAVSEPVEIHTIDKYQGRDKDCIVVSFVRSCKNPRNNNSSSLLGDWHRINVALTRAKKKLIMVGSCGTLSKVPLLKLLINKVEELSGMLVVSNKDINYHRYGLKRCSSNSLST